MYNNISISVEKHNNNIYSFENALSLVDALTAYRLRQVRSYIYAKTHLRTHLDPNNRRFYHNSDRFLMLNVYKTCA